MGVKDMGVKVMGVKTLRSILGWGAWSLLTSCAAVTAAPPSLAAAPPTAAASVPGVPIMVPMAPSGVPGGKLPTRWDKDIDFTRPLPEYPRPQMTRSAWQSLNGPWSYALTDANAATPPAAYDGMILVPYPYESALSGVGQPSPTTQRLWYKRAFTVPAAWRTSGEHVLLHFGAVNWDSAVFVNGQPLGQHKGGYDAFSYDVTAALVPGQNTLVVSASNPLASDVADAQVLGKQRVRPGGIFYTGATGIWQSVWLEPVPAAHIQNLTITPDVDKGVVRVRADVSAPDASAPDASAPSRVRVTALDGGQVVASATGAAGQSVSLVIPHARLWSPSDPHLYALTVSLFGGKAAVSQTRDSIKPTDSVGSYFAMRKVSLGKDSQGHTRILLNNRFLFQVGVLDQGYWPDGIYTAPTDDALRADIAAAKGLGFNMLRKHAKVEPERYYYWADRLGMLVWQDMPQCFAAPDGTLSDAAKAQWLAEWKQEIAQHENHPCIIVWVPFNEGWGQHDTEQIVSLTHQLDPTRLVDDASGWTDKGIGDIEDAHAYPGPSCGPPSGARASVSGEFGGLALPVAGHDWSDDVYGYGRTLVQGWTLTQKYQGLLKSAYQLRDAQGVSAVIYTQLTDVEEEQNGLLTYDRAVVKPLAGIVASANRGEFEALPAAPAPPVSHDLVATSEYVPQTWRYTTSAPAGATPTSVSAVLAVATSATGNHWYDVGFDDSGWKSGSAPFGQGYDGVNTAWTQTPGDIWLRRTVTLPASVPQNLVILALHDEDIQVYVNGVLAASAPGYTSDYVRLPMSAAARAAVKAGGENVLAVHCHQTTGGQVVDVGITGG